jgi:mRNA interferase RelE/StbE
MENYRILFRRSAVKELEDIPSAHLKRIVSRIESLIENPRPKGCRKISSEKRYRLRQGPYRIVYSVSDEEKIVIITKIGHRREIYRR